MQSFVSGLSSDLLSFQAGCILPNFDLEIARLIADMKLMPTAQLMRMQITQLVSVANVTLRCRVAPSTM